MQFDFKKLSATERYKLLLATVLPLPIAWITSKDVNDAVNLAPSSFPGALRDTEHRARRLGQARELIVGRSVRADTQEDREAVENGHETVIGHA